MNTPGRKYIVLSPEAYEMLTLATTKNRNDVSKNSDNDEHLTRNNNNNKIQELLQAREKFAMFVKSTRRDEECME